VSDIVIDPTNPSLLDYAEVNFYLADAAERSISGTAAAAGFYNKGITASFNYWGLSNAEATAYLLKPNVAYATAPGTWQVKLEINCG
jgi:hypothetical protein